VLVVMAGLPGTGKSALASRLSLALHGVVLSKDTVRAALFPGAALDCSSAQDEIAMAAVYAAAEYLLVTHPARPVVIDGRTFSKPGQLAAPLALAAKLRVPVRVIECVCAPAVAEARIAADRAAGTHEAPNRTPELHAKARAAAVPLTVPRLTLDTGALALAACETAALAYLSE
jgi:predicted kinase